MKNFIAIENMFPEWEEAKEVILYFLPEKFTFYVFDDNTLVIDYRFVYDIIYNAPEKYKSKLTNLLQECLDMIEIYFLPRLFENGIGRKNEPETLAFLNNILQTYEIRREQCGDYTIRDMFLHFLGVQYIPRLQGE